jgi:predicted PurR-regulated permease PerM
MTEEETSTPLAKFAAFATFCLVVFMLRWAKEIVIPLALAALLAFLLSPLVARLVRLGLGRILSVIVASVLGLGLLTGVAWVVTKQTLNVVQQLPKYEENIEAKINHLSQPRTPTALTQAAVMVDKIQQDLKASEATTVPATTADGGRAPVRVQVEPVRTSMLDMTSSFLASLIGPLTTAAIVMVFVVAMLMQREDLRSRFIKMTSTGSLNVATQALDDAAQRVSRYLTMQLVVNASYGIPVGLGLWLIGIPNAALWGFLSTVLRFIPYLGPWLAAACPLALAMAIDPGWGKLLLTFGLFVFAEAVTANIIEVWIYGVRTGISSFALMVAAVFWTWLWGPAGLFLSTPLTVCLMVLGKHLPGLKIFGTLLSSEPVLQPPAQLYQRMLAMDADEMLNLATKAVEESSLAEFYNDVFIPALIMSEEDRHTGTLAEVRQKFIFQSGRELILELQRRSDQAGRLAAPGPASAPPQRPWVVLGIPARDEADELAALMVQHLLHERGIRAEVSPAIAVPSEFIAQFRPEDIKVAFVSALPPSTLVAARQVSRHLREHCPGLKLIIGVWSGEADAGKLKHRLRALQPSEVVTRLTDAVAQIERYGRDEAAPAPAAPPAQAAAIATEVDTRLGLLDAAPEDWCDTVARDLAQAFDVPTSLVTIVNQDQQFWKSRSMRIPGFAYSPDAPREAFLFGLGATSSDLVVVEDVMKEPRYAANAFLQERGVRFFAVMPLRTPQGHTIACLCVIDTKARQLDEKSRNYFRQRIAELMEALLSLPEAAEPVAVRVGRVE